MLNSHIEIAKFLTFRINTFLKQKQIFKLFKCNDFFLKVIEMKHILFFKIKKKLIV